MKFIYFLTYVFLLLLYTTNLIADDFIIAGAANIQYALEALKKEYSKSSGNSFKTVFSSSGKLSAQIQNGAPYAIFLSADMDYPQKLYKAGFAIAEPSVYAKGQIVLWSNRKLISKDIKKILTSENVKSIAIANPALAPYGKESINILENLKLYEALKSKIVFAESISQVNQYILSGSVEFGFTAKSIVSADEVKDKGDWIDIDTKLYSPINQGIVILNFGLEHFPVECKTFYNFIFSEKAQRILKAHGYIIDAL